MIKILSGAVSDAEDDIFQLEGRFERLVHFWVLVCKSFTRNRCPIRAAALSYSSLLALIPLLAGHQRHQQPVEAGGRGENLPGD